MTSDAIDLLYKQSETAMGMWNQISRFFLTAMTYHIWQLLNNFRVEADNEENKVRSRLLVSVNFDEWYKQNMQSHLWNVTIDRQKQFLALEVIDIVSEINAKLSIDAIH